MNRSIHITTSVDIDRFSDDYLRRQIIPACTIDGRRPTVAELRRACAEARAKGLEVFPAPGCDNADPVTGRCLGHPQRGASDT